MKRYPEYRDSGVEWIEAIPEGWSIIRLKHIGRIKYGLGQPPRQLENGLPLIRATNIERGRVVSKDLLFVDPEDVPFERDPVLKENDIIIVRSGAYTGDSAIIPKEYEGAITGYDMVLRVDKANPRFVAYCLLSNDILVNQLYLSRMRAAQPHLNAEELGETNIAVPSSEEQETLTDYLDRKTQEIDTLIRKKQALIDLLREQRAAVINRAVTKGLDPNAPMKDSGIAWLGEVPAHWNLKKLKWASTKIGSGITPKGGAEVYEEEGIPLLRSQNIHFDGIRTEGLVFISEDVHESMIRSKVESGDVLINITGASIGRCACVPDSFGEANVNQHVCIIRPNSMITSDYLHLTLSSIVGQYQVWFSQNGAAREGLNYEQLGNFVIPCPDVPEQVAICSKLAERLSDHDQTIDKEEQSIQLLQELRTSLISEVVTGKIDVREEVEMPGVEALLTS